MSGLDARRFVVEARRLALAAGWRVEPTRKGERWTPPTPGAPAIHVHTPHGSILGRNVLNLRAQLRRAGLDV